MSPKLFHAKTAAELIKRDFPEFADDGIVEAVRYHTTGRRGMSHFEGLLYLADYIEETRKFEDCIELRRFFWDAVGEGRDTLETIYVRTMIRSFDMTVGSLISENMPIDKDTIDARNYFLEIFKERSDEI